MRHTELDLKIGGAMLAVVKEEAERQEKSLRSISLAVSPKSPNTINEWGRAKKGRVPLLSMLFKLEKALDVPAHELAYRIGKRLQGDPSDVLRSGR